MPSHKISPEAATKIFALKMIEEMLDDTLQCRRIWAHELRGPLSPILTAAQILKKPEGLDEESLSWAAKLLENKVTALTVLAQDIQDGRTPKLKEFFKFGDLAEAALSAIEETTGQKLTIEYKRVRDSSFLSGPLNRWINPFCYLLLNQAMLAGGETLIVSGSTEEISIISFSNQAPRMESAPEEMAVGWLLVKQLLARLGGELSGNGNAVTIKFQVS